MTKRVTSKDLGISIAEMLICSAIMALLFGSTLAALVAMAGVAEVGGLGAAAAAATVGQAAATVR